jgi:DNA-binding transcriptional LysR family regulator
VKLLRAVAERGEGIALLPDISAAKSVREGTLVRVLPDYHGGEGSLRAVYPSPRHLSPKVRAFIDFVAEWLAKHRPDLLICGQSARGAGG